MEQTAFSVRHAEMADLPRILEIYESARQYMRSTGNPHQWGSTHPAAALLLEDIAQRRLYVCMDTDQIVGVFCYFQGTDPTYLHIYEGSWQNDAPYGVIHRIAVDAHQKGVASFCFDYALSRCADLRIDTHRDNVPMQRALEKNGFIRCGIIYLANGAERIAFQKTRT